MKKIFPFIREGLVILFLYSIFATAALYSASIIITDNHLLFWSAISFLIIATLYCVDSLKRFFLVLIDIIFKQRKEVKGIITDIIPIQSSCFSEKWQKHRIRSIDMEYYISIEVKGEKIILLSRDNDFLIKNEKLNIQYTRFSHIVLNVKALNS